MAINPTTAPSGISSQDGSRYSFALTALTSLFFLWGFLTCLNDILIPHLKQVFSLNYTQAMLIQFCFFGAYFIASLPAGVLVQRIGYQKGIVVGLAVAGIGCALFYPAASYQVYGYFLGALFVLATGITILQVSANPYVTILGSEKTASSRLNLTQAFNSLGTTVAPFFGAVLILSVASGSSEYIASDQIRQAEAESVKIPYLMLAGTLFILAAIFSVLRLPSFKTNNSVNNSHSGFNILEHKRLLLGAIGIFVYVGAEVSIGSLLINFLAEPDIAGLAESEAAHYVAYYWGAAMVGRFLGSAIMTKIKPGYVLTFNATSSVILIVLSVLTKGSFAMWSILMVGLCNSIMFPTIFSLALKGLGSETSKGSGVLCLAIVGGAVIPLVHGMLADIVGLQNAFLLPALCYIYIAYYGLFGSR